MRIRNALGLFLAVAVGLIAVTGCDFGADSPEATFKPTVLDLLKSEPEASLSKSIETLGKAKYVTFTGQTKSAKGTDKVRGSVVLGGTLTAELITQEAGAKKPTTVRMLGSTFYVELDAEQRATFDGKHWMRMEMGTSGEDLAEQYQDINPRAYLEYLSKAGKLTVVGDDTAGGIKTVRYSVAIPVADYLESLTKEQRDAAKKELDGVTEVKMEAWIDEKYLLLRSQTVAGDQVDTTNFGDYDKPVTIEVPKKSDFVDFDEVVGG